MKTAVASRQARPSRTDKNGRLSHAGREEDLAQQVFVSAAAAHVCLVYRFHVCAAVRRSDRVS